MTVAADWSEGGRCTVLLRVGYYLAAVYQWEDLKLEGGKPGSVILKNLRELPDGGWLVERGTDLRVRVRRFESTTNTEFEFAFP